MNRNPRLSKKMHPLRENTMRLGDAMKYGRILLDAGIPIHLWDGSGWEIAFKPDDSYSTPSGRAASGGRRYLAKGAGLIKTWPITLLSEAIRPGAFIGVPAIRHFLAHRKAGVASNGRVCPNPLCKATARRNNGETLKDLDRKFYALQDKLDALKKAGQAGSPQCMDILKEMQVVARERLRASGLGSHTLRNPRRQARRNHAGNGATLKIGDHVSLVNTSFAAAGPFKSKYAKGEHVMTPPVNELNKHKSIWTVRTGAAGVVTAVHRWPYAGIVNYVVKFERGYSILGRKHLARIHPGKGGARRNSETVNANERIQHEQIVGAFLSGQKKKVGPRYWTDGTLLRVWGNLVAKRDPTGVELYDAGYRTLLTKNILNTVLRHLGQGHIYQKAHQWYISTPRGDVRWPGNWTVLTGGAAANRRRSARRNGRGESLTVSDISQWIDNDEGLYNWWRGSRQSKTAFIRANRSELEAAIRGALNRPPAQKTWRDYAGMNPRVRAWDIVAYIPGKPERWTMQSGIKDKKRAEETAQVYRDIAKKERRRHRYVVRPFRYSDTASRMKKNPVEGWVVTRDGETLKTGFANHLTAMGWLHRQTSTSVDHAVKHEGYDIVEVRGGKVVQSYKRDVIGNRNRYRTNPLTARESARLIRAARGFMAQGRAPETMRKERHYRFGQASGLAAAVQVSGPRRAEVPAAMVRGRAMKAHRVTANPRRRRHAGLRGLMSNGDAKSAMRFA